MRYPDLSAAAEPESRAAPRRAAGLWQSVARAGGEALLALAAAGILIAGTLLLR